MPKITKTLLFTLEYPPFKGGVANYYFNLAKFWPEEIQVFHWQKKAWLPAFFGLAKIIKKNKINNILTGQILPLGTVSYLIYKLFKVKYSVILHGMDFAFALKTKRKKFLAKLILKNSEKIICANSYTADLVKKFLGEKYFNKIKIVNPGVSTFCHSREIGNPGKIRNKTLDSRFHENDRGKNSLIKKYNLENKIILLTVARLVRRKGLDRVLESLPKALKKIPNLVYAILGQGEEDDNLKALIKKLKLEKNVIIINNASDRERDAWYDLANIFILAARNINGDFEGFGIVYLEANLHSLPVIAGDSGGVRDAVVNNLNGLLINPENNQEITQAILKFAQDKNLREKLGQAGKQRVLKEFRWEDKVKNIYNLIHENN